MILDEIKKANMTALKNKDQNARAIYSVIVSKAMLETVEKRKTGEELKDEDLVKILLKTSKELKDEAESYEKAGNKNQAELVLAQKELIETYLPKMLDEDEIYDIISKQEDKSIPSIMKFFKANYAGKVEMSKVSAVLRKFN